MKREKDGDRLEQGRHKGGVRGQLRWKEGPKPEAKSKTPRAGRAPDLGVDVHLSRAEQQTDHLQVPNFGGMVEAGGTVLLLGETRAAESSGRHLKPSP